MTTAETTPSYNELIREFYSRLVGMLTLPASENEPGITTDLYPAGQPPTLLIYIGAPDPAHFLQIRSQLPQRSYLFWLYPPSDPAQAKAFEQGLPMPGRNMACMLGPGSFYIDRVQILVSMLPERHIRLVVAHGYKERYKDELTEIEKSIGQMLENSTMDKSRGLLRLRCSLHNFPHILRCSNLKPLKVPPGTDAVVCGAGPSLAGQFEQLKAVAGHAVIVAVGHAVASLVRAGINPDVVVEGDTLAGQNWPADMAHMDSVLVACTEVSPEVADRFDHILFCYGSALPFTIAVNRWGFQLLDLRMAKTISVTAIDLALRLGCSRVALIGQDLCISSSRRSHVDGTAVADRDDLFEVPGNDGEPVMATADLTGLRDSIQDYLKMVHEQVTTSTVYNCTQGGAVIEHTERKSFADFCSAIGPSASVPPLFEAGEPTAFSPSLWEDMVARLRDYISIAETIEQCCRRLRRELESVPVRMNLVRRQQDQLQQAVREEEAKRTADKTGVWINTLVQYGDHIMKETPGLVSTDPDPFAQLAFLQTRFGFIRDLCDDIRADLLLTLSRLQGGGPRLGPEQAGGGPYLFRSFKQLAISVIRARNAELADWLNDVHEPVGGKFSIYWVNQILPYVTYLRSDGNRHPLSAFLSMYSDASEDLRRYFVAAKFDPDRHAVIFIAPGNWVHIFAFIKCYPKADIMIIEPWIELLSALMDRGCFMHLLPRNNLVVGVHSQLKHWQTLFLQQVRMWKEQKRELLWFIPERAGQLETVQDLNRQLTSLVEGTMGQ